MLSKLFYISYTIVIAHNMLKTVTLFNPVFFNAVYILAMAILGGVGILNISKTSRKKFAIATLVTISLLSITYLTKDVFLLTIWLTVIAFRGMKFDKLIKYDITIKTILLFIVILLSKIGLTESETFYRGEIVRATMGFSNPNVFSSFVMSIVIEWLYLRRKRLNIFDLALSVVSILAIVSIAGSRMQGVAIGIIFVMLLLSKKKNNKKHTAKKIARFVGRNAFAIVMLVSLFLTSLYANNTASMREVDALTSGRLHISARVVNNYGIEAFGNSSFSKDLGESTIDNQSIYVLVLYGYVPAITLCVYMNRYMKYLDDKNKKEIYLIMLVFIISGLVEKVCLRPQYNLFIIYSSHMLFDKVFLDRKEGNKGLPIDSVSRDI